MFRPSRLSALLLLLPLASACAEEDPTALEPPPALLSVAPQDGSVGVDPAGDVVLEFDHALRPGMEAYVDLHEGDLTGPVVPGVWVLADGGRTLRFTPDQPLKPFTGYTIHVGGGMWGADGQPVDLERHRTVHGGAWAPGSMMGEGWGGPGYGGGQGPAGGHHGPGDGPYGPGYGPHAGEGWAHPDNGTGGMTFTFTTGA